MKKNKKKKVIEKISEVLLLVVLGSIIGFIYEELFYRIDYGMWVKRGTSFGPWVPIYGVGVLVMTLFNEKLKDKPFLVFINSAIISFIVEFSIGYFLLHVFNTRIWDYNTELWNWGNIGGFVCFRSIALFALGGLFLEYTVKPAVHKLYTKKKNKGVVKTGLILGAIFIIDVITAFFVKFF